MWQETYYYLGHNTMKVKQYPFILKNFFYSLSMKYPLAPKVKKTFFPRKLYFWDSGGEKATVQTKIKRIVKCVTHFLLSLLIFKNNFG